jgi:hypothetical protein
MPPQHGPTAGPNPWDKSGLPLPNRGALSDRQATHHHLRKIYSSPISRADLA